MEVSAFILFFPLVIKVFPVICHLFLHDAFIIALLCFMLITQCYVNYTLCHVILMCFDLASSDVIKDNCDAPKGLDGPWLTRHDGMFIIDKNYARISFFVYSSSLGDFVCMMIKGCKTF